MTEAATLEEQRAALAAQEVAFAERERKLQRRENEGFVAGLVTEGRLPPGHKARVLDLMEHLDGSKTVDFGEGAAKATLTPLAAFQEFLSFLPKTIEFGELAGADKQAPAAGGNAEALAQAATVYMAEKAKAGVTVSAAEAVRAVRGLR
jgi:hypothetical protein